ncbi:MAG TPA: peptidoglycan DD-metalloendopeptidase family protein [Candidatus Ozemobacteraceae bacterium]|nr:peptidoglycan DD-metalloendopeptidase family protein [Candidatus Ozemobacteraceae bacterium]
MSRTTIAAAGTALLLFLIAGPAPAAVTFSPERLGKERNRIESLRSELDSVRLQIEYLDVKVRDTRGHVRRLEEKISRQQARIAEIQGSLDSIASESARITTQIDGLRKAIDDGQRRMGDIRRRFRGRLVHLHRVRQSTLFSSIFSARDLNAFISRYEMVRHLLQGDRALLAELNARSEQLERDAAALRDKQARLEELAAQTMKNREALVVEGSSLSAMLQTLLLERKVFLARQKKLKKSLGELEQEVAKIETERLQDPDSVDRALDAQPPSQHLRKSRPSPPPPAFSASGAAVPSNIGNDDGATTGRFRWPLRNVEGLSFESSTGAAPPALELVVTGETEVLASARGKVQFKGPVGQFGNIVIISHKQGFSTVYGRLDDVWVGLGEIVDAGDVIGRIFGVSQNRLHFEIRFAGKNVDPLAHLPKIR